MTIEKRSRGDLKKKSLVASNVTKGNVLRHRFNNKFEICESVVYGLDFVRMCQFACLLAINYRSNGTLLPAPLYSETSMPPTETV